MHTYVCKRNMRWMNAHMCACVNGIYAHIDSVVLSIFTISLQTLYSTVYVSIDPPVNGMNAHMCEMNAHTCVCVNHRLYSTVYIVSVVLSI